MFPSAGALYSLEELLAAEARAVSAREANNAERLRAVKRTVKVSKLRAHARRMRAYRMIGEAMDLVGANLWRGGRRSVGSVLLFERQWRWECRELGKRGVRVSGLDAVEQFVRRVRLWRVAGVLR